jgi:hypothetical protein
MYRMLLAGLTVVLLGAANAQQDQKPAPAAKPPEEAVKPGLPGQLQPQALPGGGGFPGPGGQQFKDLVPSLIEALKDSDNEVRRSAAATLVVIGREAVPSLLDMLKGKDAESRANAAYVLGQMGHAAQEALPALVKAMKDDDKAVRARAAFAVHHIVRDVREGGPGMGGPGMGGMAGMPGMGGPGFGSRSGRPRGAGLDVPDPGLIYTGGGPRQREVPAKDEPEKK